MCPGWPHARGCARCARCGHTLAVVPGGHTLAGMPSVAAHLRVCPVCPGWPHARWCFPFKKNVLLVLSSTCYFQMGPKDF